ncbi:MAG: YeeE/YedE family protein, partial [Halobacteriota archaeon]
VGTRLGKGCTSGHGVCGIGSGSGTSIANVATFMVVAIGVAQLLSATGVTP